MNVRKGAKYYEGKAKKLYLTDNPDLLIQEFKDSATAFDGAKKGTIRGKGSVNNQVSAHLFRYLESYHIPTHFVRTLSDREMLVKKVEIIPVEVVVRNVVAGSLAKRLNEEEGRELSEPILEFYLKDDALHDPMITEEEITQRGLANARELDKIKRMALKINAVLKDFFARRKLRLVDFKLEFGRHGNEILLADEISPDTCRLWDAETGERLDKDRFRRDLPGVVEAYREVQERVLGGPVV
ncbi:MAG: phosphoribosylaminoimidazolesuccinocarboxamide synthase [candidate division KSB1 bacterium]|nr:phosphoribosylaminoimidazolesuccinocarboxamide synthase [candidate division KSB1 bacterium]